MTSDGYYHDPTGHPFDLLEIRRRKKGEVAGERSDDGIELGEYVKLRAERVSRNVERLRSLEGWLKFCVGPGFFNKSFSTSLSVYFASR